MSGHRPFSELTKKFSPKRKARTAAKLRTLKAEMPLAELRHARERSQDRFSSQTVPSATKPGGTRQRTRKA
jgi:hypothetical protein